MASEWLSIPVFVYGTLKKGHPNHFLLTENDRCESVFLGKAVTVDAWPLVIATPFNIPFLLDSCGIGKRVTGELYRVNATMLNTMDWLEGHPDFYIRSTISVELLNPFSDDGYPVSSDDRITTKLTSEVVQCEVYLLSNFKKDLLQLDYLDCYPFNPSKQYVPGKDRPVNSASACSFVKEVSP